MPARLNKMYPTVSNTCWCCGMQPAAFYHKWWLFTKIGKSVFITVKEMTHHTLPFCAKVCVLNDLANSTNRIWDNSKPLV